MSKLFYCFVWKMDLISRSTFCDVRLIVNSSKADKVANRQMTMPIGSTLKIIIDNGKKNIKNPVTLLATVCKKTS